MKAFLFIAGLLITSIASAQIPGTNFNGPLLTKYGDFKKGDTVKIGTGSNPDGDFKFIYQPANYIIGTKQINMPKMYSNTRLEIKHFKRWNSDRFGTKDYTIVRFAGLNAVIEMESAIEAGEVIVPNYNPKSQLQTSAPSIADEIIKLKGLLDSGAITQTEYDAQKKKVLGQ